MRGSVPREPVEYDKPPDHEREADAKDIPHMAERYRLTGAVLIHDGRFASGRVQPILGRSIFGRSLK